MKAWQTPALDGKIYGQPLVYGPRVYVATENDTVYALDASTGAVVWQKHLATAVSGTQPPLPCPGNIHPTVGITSTPVIDPSTGRIYVVADAWDGSNAASVAHEMFALNLTDGSVAVGPVGVDPPGSTPSAQLQRVSLALDAGKVIIGYGGNAGDCGNYHGWLVAVPEGGGPLQTFEVDGASGESQGAIWASGNAPAIDAAGNIWVATGNGSSTTADYQESVIKLDPNLNVLDWWTPSNWAELDSPNDNDIGSSMPLLLPGGLAFQIGKEGVGYLLSASSLGHTGATPYHYDVCSGIGSWGGGIYENGVIYVACGDPSAASPGDGIRALALDTTHGTLAPLAGWTVPASATHPPIFAGGLVWSAGNDGVLYGLDPSTGATRFSTTLGGFEHFTTPSAAGGRLFVANEDLSVANAPGQVTAFKIADAPPASATTTTLSSSKNPAAPPQAVTYTATVSPAPDSGTVAFADSGVVIPGCAAVPVSAASGQAACTTTYRSVARRVIEAVYSGDPYYAFSRSSTLTQVITKPGPSISHLHVKVSRSRRLTLTFTMSEQANVTVIVSRVVAGRRVGRRCRANARRGKRCTILVRKATLRLLGKRDGNSFKLRMRPLAPGQYTLTLTAVDAAGARSKTYTIKFKVPPRRRRR